ncbi:hypothetical protein NEOLEDRAFT_894401 [Neolentinus lepideus HHB14362 ss-1]|uniref:FCP1 homology domain-containing protein n=1 Tax=Neolentinus lepideus HHB14362 ss-1 TaxID=1314782 RepID=A0A165NSF7_9AGAM|nr:hypothetical protein NEOLEDRAFT_894401 [Neolentinus lepideus HHB14362 ss-1]
MIELLEVVVWSSTQPHSALDMMMKSFGQRRQDLKAVWARDTFEFSSNQHDMQTTPQDCFASIADKNAPPFTLQFAICVPGTFFRDDTRPRSSKLTPLWPRFSSMTRLPACISSHTTTTTRASRSLMRIHQRIGSGATELEEASSKAGVLSPGPGAKKRGRKKKKAVALVQAVEDAVVGILDEINVAGWIGRGGSWARCRCS